MVLKKKEKIQLIWFFAVIVMVFVVFLGSYYYVKNMNKFEYVGVSWEKINYNGLTLYHSTFPFFGNTYNMYLREDPRQNNVSVGNLSVRLYPKVVVTLQPEAGACYGASLAQVNLGQFLGAAQRQVVSAVTDKEAANQLGVNYATCADAINQTVILIQKSDVPNIQQEGNCYIINVGNCENNKAMEKFLIAIIAQMMKQPM